MSPLILEARMSAALRYWIDHGLHLTSRVVIALARPDSPQVETLLDVVRGRESECALVLPPAPVTDLACLVHAMTVRGCLPLLTLGEVRVFDPDGRFGPRWNHLVEAGVMTDTDVAMRLVGLRGTTA